MRDPSADQNPLDRASFYIEELKYGPGAGTLEAVTDDDIVGQLDVLLREADVTSMTGAQLWRASDYYGRSMANVLRIPLGIPLSIWVDGLMHGIALAAGIEGPYRNPKGQ